MLRTTLKQPCMQYKPTFEHEKLEKVALIQVYDGMTKKKKCPTFTGEFGIESLLYVEDRYRAVSRQLDYTTGAELFDNFEEVVLNTAEEKWMNLVQNLTPAEKTPARFDALINRFYLSYCDSDSRDTMFKYLRYVKKPYQEEAQAHADRMETLIRFSNRLPGLEPPLQAEQTKTIIFDSFPIAW